MKKSRIGFTLIEMMVVVLIMGILASIGIPQYLKTVETSKATDAVAVGQMLANGYRMFQIDNPGVALSGQIDNTCNNAGSCSPADTSSCRLVRCSYVAQQQWSAGSYKYFVGGSCGGNASCVSRNGGSAPYSGWGYNFSTSGACSVVGGAPSCPKF